MKYFMKWHETEFALVRASCTRNLVSIEYFGWSTIVLWCRGPSKVMHKDMWKAFNKLCWTSNWLLVNNDWLKWFKCEPITKYGNSNCEHCFAMYVSMFWTAKHERKSWLNWMVSLQVLPCSWLIFPSKTWFFGIYWIFSGRNHFKINISHILNPNLTK